MKRFKLLFLTTTLIFSSLLFAADGGGGGGGGRCDGDTAAAAAPTAGAGAGEKKNPFSFSEESRKKLREDLDALQKKLLKQKSLIIKMFINRYYSHSYTMTSERVKRDFKLAEMYFKLAESDFERKIIESFNAKEKLTRLIDSLYRETQKAANYKTSLGPEDSMKSLMSYKTLGFIFAVLNLEGSKKKEVILPIFSALSAKNYKEFCEQSSEDVIVTWQKNIIAHAKFRESLSKELPRKSNPESQDLSDEQASEGLAYRPANQHHNIMSPRTFYRRFRSHNRDDAFMVAVSKIFSTFLEEDIKTHDPIAKLQEEIKKAEIDYEGKHRYAYESQDALEVLAYQKICMDMREIEEVLLYSSLPSLLSGKPYTAEEHQYWKNIFRPQKLKATRNEETNRLTGDPVCIDNLKILTDIANEVLSQRISADNLLKLRKEGGQEISDDSYELKKHNFYVEYYRKTIENSRGDGQQGWLNGAIARLVGLETEFPKLPECRIPFLKEFGLYDVALDLKLI